MNRYQGTVDQSGKLTSLVEIPSIGTIRRRLTHSLLEWRQAGGSVHDVVDDIEGLISAKIDEILDARKRNEAIR